MNAMVSVDRVRFLVNRFRERLWVRPLTVCLLSIGAAFVAKLFDSTALGAYVPAITSDSIEALLSIMAASMLVIATFSVASMVSAYAAASNTATPRSFSLVVADDASQNALSAFVGAFIFSVVALTAAKNDYFETAGLFILFALTVLVFAVVILTFVRWVDGIARLGRLGSTMDKVEKAAGNALIRRRDAPTMNARVARARPEGATVFATTIGYVQYVDIAALQTWAEAVEARVVVAALPGTFVTPDRPLAYVCDADRDGRADRSGQVADAFQVGDARRFEDDPRFGLVVLSEIAGRALSPAVNDPGTAIDVVGRLVRLFHQWCEPAAARDADSPMYERVEVPRLSVREMFDDAFTAIARDGAGQVEVSVRLQKALRSLASIGDASVRDAARHHRALALARAGSALDQPEDLAAVRDAAGDNAK
ncbi:DUF2254 domain-containing protein [Salinisphaera sp. P385]|uniref:DUF2254 domain-containing protein n=1 Tax=Spectribacter acetivorans TaxID=3075603 RepID=A0ABU3B637_9GAMM|nr:DUF2254 domain-containing protein [Salinisphaera sp. P385]MDT0617916.1 DUF2254 domain-containing protein [Salinisphaera sp. P385]